MNKNKPLIKRIDSDENKLLYELKSIGVDPYAYRLKNKGVSYNIKIYSVTPAAANILKQEALSIGIDAAVAKGTVNCSVDSTDVLILSDKSSIKKLIKKISKQPFGLKEIAISINNLLENEIVLNFKDINIDLKYPVIMGILNCTPDSFSDGGKYLEPKIIEKKLNEFLENSINFIDIGGESSRPGAEPVTEDEELKRILPAIEIALKKNMIISVDTYKFNIAKRVLEMGVHLINDITGLNNNKNIAKLCADYNAGLCVMHMQGTPSTMQNNPHYDNLLDEIYSSLYNSIDIAISKGLKKENIIADIGFGFGKTLQNNYTILKNLKEFKSLGTAILAGVSRKSMIGLITNEKPDERVCSSKIIETIAILNGANIIRTHDIKESKIMKELLIQYKEAECG